MANNKNTLQQRQQHTHIHPDDIEDEDSNFSYNPKEAGPSWWDVWHMMAAQANTLRKRKLVKQFVENHIPMLFGCKLCREHFAPKLKKFDINKYMDSAYQIWLHSYLVHDDVNKDLGKHSPSIEEARKRYFPAKSATCAVFCEEGSDEEGEEEIEIKEQKKAPRKIEKKTSPARSVSGLTVTNSLPIISSNNITPTKITTVNNKRRETQFYIRT